MSDQLTSPKASAECPYCGEPLDARVYFCPRCAKPHRSVEQFLPASLPEYSDLETKLRTGAKPAWTLFFVYLSVILLGGSIAASVWGEEGTAIMLFLDLALLITTLVFLFRYWPEVLPFLKRPGFFKAPAWLGLLLLVPLLVLNFGYHHLLVDTFGIEMEDYTTYFSSSWGPLIFICITPAIVEEIGFRGIIQHQFEKAVSPWMAIGVTSLLFSAAHFSVLSAPYLALMGVLLGWLKWKTGSLYPSIVTHFLHNYIVVTHF